MNSYTNELIDAYKKAINVESDYAVAKALGLRANRISNYRTGISHADDKTAVMLATVLHLDPLETIARIDMDRATDTTDKAFWRKLAGSTAGLIALWISVSVAGTLSPTPAYASAQQHYQDACEDTTQLGIMRNAWHRLTQALGALFTGRSHPYAIRL